MLTIVGLGAGDADDITRKVWGILERAETVYLRTERHPCVPELPKNADYIAFDSLYERHERFEDVYAQIVATVLEQAHQEAVVYAVPGDPMVGERTVILLLEACQRDNVAVEVAHGVSFIEPMLRHVGIDGMNGLQVFDALDIGSQHHPSLNPAFPALIGQVYNRQVASDVKLTLMNQYPDDFEVTLIHGAGTAEVTIEPVPLYEIDRSRSIHYLTSLYVPSLGQYTSFESFQETVAHLRAPEGCPWDKAQTHDSLRKYLIEEAYEVLDAIERDDMQALSHELGDLLLQVALHTQIAIDEGEFYMADVLDYVNRKMIRRHPHVWGDVEVNGSAETVLSNWDAIKRAEKEADGTTEQFLLDRVLKAQPALMTAFEYSKQASKVGFDWETIEGVHEKVQEELNEILEAKDISHKISEIGDLIYVLVNWLRWLGNQDPESLLRDVNAKFYRRFCFVEAELKRQGKSFDTVALAEMDALWNEAKRQGL